MDVIEHTSIFNASTHVNKVIIVLTSITH